MDRDIRIYFLFIGVPAILLTAAGLLMLVFGVSGLSEEIKSPGYEQQRERYERNVKGRMSSRVRSFRQDGKADFVWAAHDVPWLTNVSARVKYGCLDSPDGTAIGWARLEDGRVIGCRMPPFRYVNRQKVYFIGIGAVMVVLLFLTLSAGGWLLARATKRARGDLEIRNTFLDLISHELNTPLGSIVPLSSALAADSIRSDGRRREAIATISREAARMARMIDELLTVVRLRNGKIRYARERFCLSRVVEQAADLVRLRYPDCAIRTVCEEPVFAFADRDKTEQVAINLLENACRYAGEETIEVACRPAEAGHVWMTVADRGEALTNEQRRHLFERFYQVRTSDAEEGQGLGLGLNIVAGFVKGMGGSIKVVARPGGGSVFTVGLPRGENPEKEEAGHG